MGEARIGGPTRLESNLPKNRKQPMQKPVGIFVELIRLSEDWQRICGPFVGSGAASMERLFRSGRRNPATAILPSGQATHRPGNLQATAPTTKLTSPENEGFSTADWKLEAAREQRRHQQAPRLHRLVDEPKIELPVRKIVLASEPPNAASDANSEHAWSLPPDRRYAESDRFWPKAKNPSGFGGLWSPKEPPAC